MNEVEYFIRLGLEHLYNQQPLIPNVKLLNQLHKAHLHKIAFENLSVILQEPIEPSNTKQLFDKIINRKRGGFCFELNPLFAWLLRKLNFKVDLLQAKVKRADGSVGEPFGHLMLHVQLDRPYLVDVGFGDSFWKPIFLDSAEPQDGGNQREYRIIEEKENGINMMQMQERPIGAADWTLRYSFPLKFQKIDSFSEQLEYHSTNVESWFTQVKLVTLANENGRLTLLDETLKTTLLNGEKEETHVQSEQQFYEIAEKQFGIKL